MLGDIDRQQSSRTWLGMRPERFPKIVPWAVDNRSILRVPAGVTHVVLDTPGGLHGFELAKVVMFADILLMPVTHSIFDLSSASQCIAELKALPRVASGKAKIGIVGMRVDDMERADRLLGSWAESKDLPYLGSLKKSQNYVNALEAGMTLFDLPREQAVIDIEQWAALTDWLDPLAGLGQSPTFASNPAPILKTGTSSQFSQNSEEGSLQRRPIDARGSIFFPKNPLAPLTPAPQAPVPHFLSKEQSVQNS